MALQVEKSWINVSTVTCSIILILFGLAQITLSLGLNIRYNLWSPAISSTGVVQGTVASASIIVMHGLFVFPAAVTGVCAAISRRMNVYVILLVLDALAFLSAAGGLVEISYLFDTHSLLNDPSSINDALAISMIVFQSLVLIMTILLGVFAVFGVIKAYDNRGGENPHQYNKYDEQRMAAYRPAAAANTAGGDRYYRPLTLGSPEWDRFYEHMLNGYGRSAGNQRRPLGYTSNSYRY